ncbi:hypothetical protein [Arthrobacter bambusae]
MDRLVAQVVGHGRRQVRLHDILPTLPSDSSMANSARDPSEPGTSAVHAGGFPPAAAPTATEQGLVPGSGAELIKAAATKSPAFQA